MRPLALWRTLFWATFAGSLLAGVLNMTGTRAGFLTNHLADLAVPAWLYLGVRNRMTPDRQTSLTRLVGATPERAALLLFLASTATEVAQKYGPHELMQRTRFDPLDILAFGVGLVPVYLLDKRMQAVAGD